MQIEELQVPFVNGEFNLKPEAVPRVEVPSNLDHGKINVKPVAQTRDALG
jgi:hypothetical protein